ncbi:DUF3857 domain-containing transglutaminase family protein [Bermanella sp. R86510]|uniref:DUF3857 domain-containing transglutaminase family protein n=1 Tax=unclassified Bermanella TaxID=2627862 RepID=UPI0037C6573F
MNQNTYRSIGTYAIGIVCFLTIIFNYGNTAFADEKIKNTVHKQNGLEVTLQQIPDWVEPRATPKPGNAKSSGNVRYHLYDQQGYADDQIQQYFRIVKEAKNTSGLEVASQHEIAYNPDFQKLFIHTANVYRNNQLVYSLDSKDIKLFSKEDELEQGLLSGLASALILIPSTQIGDIIDIQYSIRGSNPVFGNRLSLSFDLGWSIPIDHAQARFVVPQNKTVKYKTLGTSIEPKITSNKFGQIYEWRLKDPTPIFDEGQYPPGFNRYPYVSISEYTSWQEVVNQQQPFYSNRALPNDLKRTIAQKVEGLSKPQQVTTALRFVQEQVRYLGLEYGTNAFKPRTPIEVWENRRGDCKEKTLLLIAILEFLDIKAYPALVNTGYREGLRNSIPAPNRFNHVITQVILGENSYWLDPTMRPQHGTLKNIGYRSYDQALILKEDQKHLTTMPDDQPENHYTFIEETISVADYTAPIKLNITSTYRGRSAEYMKSKFDDVHIGQLQHEFIQYYEKLYGEVLESEPLRYEYNHELNEFTFYEHYIIYNFFDLSQGEVSFGIGATALNEHLHIPRQKNRTSPFYLGRPKQVRHQIKIHFPKEELNAKPDITTKISNDSFDYEYKNIMLPNTYLMNFQYNIKKANVSKQSAKSVITDLNEVNNISYQSFNYRPDSAFIDTIVSKLMKHRVQSPFNSVESGKNGN